MYKNIVVAVDGSDTSRLALQEAMKLAKGLKAKLYILHIADEHISNWLGVPIDMKKCQDKVKEYSREVIKSMEQETKNVGIDATCQLLEYEDAESSISDKILEYTQQLNADLLVIGTHGRRGVRRILLGSVAEEIIHIATLPVLLIRKNKPS